MTVPEYQAFPEGNPAKDWQTVPLHMCSKKRMDFIAKEIYKIPETSKLSKDPLYRAIFDHMLQEQECTTCASSCRPDVHPFLPIEDPPTEGSLRNSGRMSPSSFVRLNDNSVDTNLGASGSGGDANSHPLFDGQPHQPRSMAVLETLQSRVNAGAIIHETVDDVFASEFDMDGALDEEEARINAELEKEAQEQTQRREAEKEKAKKKADSSASFELRRKALEDKLRAKARETQQSLEASHRAEVQALSSKPTRRGSDPTRNQNSRSSGVRFSQTHEVHHIPDDDGVFSGPNSAQNLTKIIAQTVTAVMDERDARSPMSIHSGCRHSDTLRVPATQVNSP